MATVVVMRVKVSPQDLVLHLCCTCELFSQMKNFTTCQIPMLKVDNHIFKPPHPFLFFYEIPQVGALARILSSKW
jgi:hypothetical protein